MSYITPHWKIVNNTHHLVDIDPVFGSLDLARISILYSKKGNRHTYTVNVRDNNKECLVFLKTVETVEEGVDAVKEYLGKTYYTGVIE